MRKIVAMLLAAALWCMPVLAEDAQSLLSYGQIVDMAQYMRQLVMGDYLDIKQVPTADQQIAVEGISCGGTADQPVLGRH